MADELIVRISSEAINYPALQQSKDIEELQVSANLKEKLNEVGVQKIERILYSIDPSKATITNHRTSKTISVSHLLDYYVVKLNGTISVDEIIRKLKEVDGVLSITKNYIGEDFTGPNDPKYYSEIEPYQWYLHRIEVEDVWDTQDIKGEDGDIVIGVVESTGVKEHEDLLGNICDTCFEDYGDHGTKVTGILGATTHNSTGIAGTPWNCEVIVENTEGELDASDLAWTMFFVGADSDVMNYSWGVDETEFMGQVIEVLDSVGVVQVAAIGNNSYNLDNYNDPDLYPVEHSLVLGVGGSTFGDDDFWSSSNYGSALDIIAPATGIVTTTGTSGYTSGWADVGTSYSAPQVTGTIALMMTKNPNLDPDDYRSIIVNNADVTSLGYKRLNAKNAVSAVGSPKPVLLSSEVEVVVPQGYSLELNYPNPFNPETMPQNLNGRPVADRRVAYLAGTSRSVRRGRALARFLPEF